MAHAAHLTPRRLPVRRRDRELAEKYAAC
jgi:hypothetical protein